MPRQGYPFADTTASRVKTLVLWLRKHHGDAASDALIQEIKIDPEYLDDETRPLAIGVWHSALVAFSSRYGRASIDQTWSEVISPDNLGVWSRVLRGATHPQDAFRQLNALGGEEQPKATQWETISSEPRVWRGKVSMINDPLFERDGLCPQAIVAELRAVPALFGMGPGEVEVLGPSRTTSPGQRSNRFIQEYCVRWGGTEAPLGRWAPIVAGSAAGLAGLSQGMGAAVGAALGVSGLTFGASTMLSINRQRRADLQAQLTRIGALERSISLKEERDRGGGRFAEGSVIAGRYRLGPRLGAGASGVIHQALRLVDHAPVAIKLLRAAVAHDSVASDRLRREAEALGLTWHPNVVEVFEHDYLQDGTGYLVMEHLDGESLATRLKRQICLTPAQTASIALQVCDALGAVHAAGVVHRDIKPSNIFMVADRVGTSSGRDLVKVLDFGIAHVEWAETRLTNMGFPLGTPGYMSPEQEQGNEVDARSDLFSLGAVIFECLTGVSPLPAQEAQIDSEAEPPSRQSMSPEHPAIPDGWQALIDRAMARLPQERFPDARTLRDALHQLAEAASPESMADSKDVEGAHGGTNSDTEVRNTNVSK